MKPSNLLASWLLGCGLALPAGPVMAQQSGTDDAALATLIERLSERSDAGLQPQALPGGGVMIDLQGRYQQLPIAQLGPDGDVMVGCVSSVGEASRFFGRDLRTGKVIEGKQRGPRGDDLAARAARHGLTPTQQRFYESLIEHKQALGAQRPKAATFTINVLDGPGEGFNDPTPRAAEGGNGGTTLGQQRLNLFNQAGLIWGAFLDSGVPIVVDAQFNPLTPCGTGGGVLGAAGTASVIRNFANAEFADTFYPIALANKRANVDLSAGGDINTQFNSDVDTGCLGAGTRFYYGFDNATPAGTVNLLVVLLHELGHGLGSATFTSRFGTYFAGSPDIWARFMFDRSVGLTWLQMNDAQRAASAINPDNVLWNGPNVRIASGFLTAARDGSGQVELYTPNPFEGGSSVSHWNTTATPNLLMEPSINIGLPLTLDLTRQQMRDIGWFRGTPGAASITQVTPSGGLVAPGANLNITWTNSLGFNRNVTIELSTDGGATFPTVIASDVTNTGTRAWTVPAIATSSARIRVREHDFVAPAGVSAANFTITSNTAPSFAPAPALSRQQGSAAGAAVAVGTVSDAQTAAGGLVVTQVAGGTANGITASGIVNNSGVVNAAVAASCTATAGTVRFQVSDGSLTGTGDLQVNVTPNTPPTLGYTAQSGTAGGSLNVNPASGPADNGTLASIVVIGQGTYTGTVSVGNTTGVVALSNLAPVGTHTITIRATDNCGSITDAAFNLTVSAANTAPTFTPAAAITRQQGSAAGAQVVVGTAADTQTAAGSLVVTQIAGGTASGITVTGIGNINGAITATLAASCTATAGTVRFQASDGSLTGTGDLQVNVDTNAIPSLGYTAQSINAGGSLAVNPATGPGDNGTIASTVLQSQGSYTGTISVGATSGVVSLSNAAPVGTHTITVRATDNCGATTDAPVSVQVNGDAVFGNGFEPVAPAND
jgi:hypothetical protein